MLSNPPSSPSLLTELQLNAEMVASLPPDVRDRLLDYAQDWAQSDDLLALVAELREAHGPLLFLLDYQAVAHMNAGHFDMALDVIERRQRRSSSAASQTLEVQALFKAGHHAHAEAVAIDLHQSHPRNSAALAAAATVLAELGKSSQAIQLLEAHLLQRPGDLVVNLAMAQLAAHTGDRTMAERYAQRLGPDVAALLPPASVAAFADTLDWLGSAESANAVRLELQRRQHFERERLATALAPYTNLTPEQHGVELELLQQLSGPASIPMQREEARRVQLEAVRHFGFAQLRIGQAETIASVLRGESLLAVMPTGAGKSLCYQLPALTLPHTALVVSPLIALMKDQVDSLPAAARSRATFINSTLTDEELQRRMTNLETGAYKLVYAAPERLRQREFLRALRNVGIDLFVIDEAHCVSLWGHDFRPDYLFISEARRELGNPPTLAMTATAPPRVRDEILDYMRSDETPGVLPHSQETNNAVQSARPHVMALDIFRNNLHLSALRFNDEDEKLAALVKFVTDTPGSGIVYVNTRHKSEALAFALRQAGVAAEAYHAGLDNRSDIQDRFMSDQTRVVVATVAFGMGIDKHDIRFIVHFHPSRSMAGYYQEVGRAGRDGKPSQGVLFYSTNDWANLRRWAKSDEYGIELMERVYTAVASQLSSDAERKTTVSGLVDARRLQQVLNEDETTVRVAISILERVDLLTRGFDVAQEMSIELPRQFPAACHSDANLRRLVRGLALKPGQAATFRTADIAAFLRLSVEQAETALLDWHAAGCLRVRGSRRAMFVEMPQQPADLRERLARLQDQDTALGQRRIDEMVGYATSEVCRHGYISAHFGSPPRTRCDVCDNCTGIRPNLPLPPDLQHLLPDDNDIEPMIIDCLISLARPVGRSGLARILTGHLRAPVTPDKARHHGALKALSEGDVLEYVDGLIEDSRLRQYERQGYMVLAPTLRGRNEAELWIAQHPEQAVYGEAPMVNTPEQADAAVEPAGQYTALQKALWHWRRRISAEMGQPPYVVMSNDLMLAIVERRPQTLDELGTLPGIGAQRLQHYGPQILDIIKLNPVGEGDAEMLATQHVTRAESKVLAVRKTVPPRVERQLVLKLQELRQKRAVLNRLKPFQIASNTLIQEIARRAPASLAELESIPGFATSQLGADATQIVIYVAALMAQNEETHDRERQNNADHKRDRTA